MIQPEDLDSELSGMKLSPQDAAWVRKNFYRDVIAPDIKGLPLEQRAPIIDRWAPKVQSSGGALPATYGARTGASAGFGGAIAKNLGYLGEDEGTPSTLDAIGDIATSASRLNPTGFASGMQGAANSMGGAAELIPETLALGGLGYAGSALAGKAGLGAIGKTAGAIGGSMTAPGLIEGATRPASSLGERALNTAKGGAEATAMGLAFHGALKGAGALDAMRAPKAAEVSKPDTLTGPVDEAPPVPLTPEELAAARRKPVSAAFERTGTPEEMAQERVVTAEPVPNALEDMSRNLGALREQAVSQGLREANPPGVPPVPNALEDMSSGLRSMRERATNPPRLLAESNPIPMRGAGEATVIERPKARPLLSGDHGVETPYPSYTEADHAHVTEKIGSMTPRSEDAKAYTPEDHAHVMGKLSGKTEPDTGSPADVARAHGLPEGSSAVDDGGVLLAKIPAEHIGVDADAYQFKAGGDAKGVTSRLHGVREWDPDAGAGNPIIVHQRADGSIYVVDGHQRVGLAHRLKAEGKDVPPLRAIVYRETMGHSQESMRRLGAMRNIQQGSGTPVDFAKVLRTRDLTASEQARLPMSSSEAIADARAIASLGDEAFHLATTGRVHPDAGKNASFSAIVGREIKNPADQLEALNVLRESPPAGRDEALDMVMSMKHDGFASSHVEQMGMFGPEVTTHSLARPIAQIMSSVRSSLAKESSALGNAIRNKGRLEAHGNKVDVAGSGGALEVSKGLRHILDVNARTGGAFRDSLREIARRMESENAGERISRKQAADEALAALEREWSAVFGKPKPVRLAGASGEQPALGRAGKPVKGTKVFTDLDEAARFIEANPDHDFHQTPSGVTVWPVKARAPKGGRSGAVNPAAVAEAAGKAVDATGRGARAAGRAIVRGADAAYDWRATKNLRKMLEVADSTWRSGWRKAVGATPSEVYTWLQHAPSDLPLTKRVRAYAISRFGLTPEMKEAIGRKAETSATMKHELLRIANHHAKMDPQTRADMYDMLAEPDIGPRSAEAQGIADRIDRISEAKVQGGMLSREAADKHAGHYLKQEYAKHAPATQRVVDWFDRVSGGGLRGYFRRGGEHTLTPKMWDTVHRDWQVTGIDHRVARGGAGIDPLVGHMVDGKGAKPGNMILTDRATGESISVPDNRVAHYTSNDWTFERWKNRDMHALEAKVSQAQRRLDDAIAKKRSPATIQEKQDALDAVTAQFLDRAKTEPIIGHRDWSRAERHQMGLKRDVVEALAKMAFGDSENVGRGEFFKEIATHPDWSVDAKTAAANPSEYADWVHMPNEKAPGSGPGSSSVRRWGALSDRYVNPELAAYVKNIDQFSGPRWFKKVFGVNLWKAFKTKYSPTFYVNQAIQNMTPYLLAGGSPLKLLRAIFDMAQVDPHAHQGGPKTYIQRMEDLSVIRDGQMVADLAEKYGRNSNAFNPLNWARDMAQVFETADRKLSDFAQFGDDVYRVALVRTKMDEGMPFDEAVQLTRDVFYRSEDVTSPLAEHASTVIPFVKYAIYAADKYPKLMLDNPAKGLALLTMWATVKEFNDRMAGVTKEQADARREALPRHIKGGIMGMIHPSLGEHIMPLPFRDKFGHQNYIDTKNYEMTGGGPFDMSETPSGWPAAAMPGGPVAIAAGELLGYDYFHDQKLKGTATDEAGNPSYDNRLKFAIDGLTPGIVSYADNVRRALSDEVSSRGTRKSGAASLAGVAGVKINPFDGMAAVSGKQAFGKVEMAEAEHRLRMATRNLAQNPDNAKMQAEFDKAMAFKMSLMRKQVGVMERAMPALGIDRDVQPQAAPSILNVGPGVNPLMPAPVPTRTLKPMATLDPRARAMLERSKGATL